MSKKDYQDLKNQPQPDSLMEEGKNQVSVGQSLSISSTTSFEISQTPTINIAPAVISPKKMKRAQVRNARLASVGEYVPGPEVLLIKKLCGDYVCPVCVLIIWAFFMIGAQYSWNMSLIGCEYDIIVCIKWLRGKFVKIILYVLLYTTCHFVIFIHALFTKNRILKYTGFTLSVGSLFYRYMVSKGFTQTDHSQANFTLAVIIMIFMTALFLWFFISFYFLFKKEKKGAYIWFGAWVFIWFMIYDLRIRRSCRHLQDSMDPEIKYTNKGNECRWIHSTICWHYTIDGIFQPLFWGRDDCKKISTDLDEHRAL